MRKNRVFLLTTITMLLLFTLVSFADSDQVQGKNSAQQYKNLAEEIEQKIETTRLSGDKNDTARKGEFDNMTISPQYEPIHECHDGPGHEECDLVAGQQESCGCYGGMWYCCCGKKMSFYYFYCLRHR